MRLPALTNAAEAKLAEFEQALATAKAAEKELFSLLFDERTGLKKIFPSSELNSAAARSRHGLRTRAMEAAGKAGYQISRRFELDGELFLGEAYENCRIAARS